MPLTQLATPAPFGVRIPGHLTPTFAGLIPVRQLEIDPTCPKTYCYEFRFRYINPVTGETSYSMPIRLQADTQITLRQWGLVAAAVAPSLSFGTTNPLDAFAGKVLERIDVVDITRGRTP